MGMKRIDRTTIRDVAAAAGVSLTTVSDALSGKGRLPPETRARIEGIAQRLHYRPNAIARGLRARSLGLIGISIAPAQAASLSGVWYWASIAIHLSEAILDEGFAPVLLPHDVGRLTRMSIPFDGAIVVDPFEGDEVVAFLRRQKIGIVTIGRDSADPQAPWVDDDTETGIHELLCRTLAPGEKLAAITLGARKSYALDALNGARRWAEGACSAMREFHCAEINQSAVDAALKKSRRWGAQAILSQNDRLACAILARLRAGGQRVPQDLRLISATDAPELQDAEPAITSLRQHPRRLGQQAAKTLFDLLQGTAVPEQLLLPVELAIRTSAPALA